MAITVLDVLKTKVGEKNTYDYLDFVEARLPMFGGCQRCEATIAAYNAYPSTTGYLKCGDCIGNMGFPSVEEFERFNQEQMDPRAEFKEDEYRYYVEDLWIWFGADGWMIFDADSGDTFMASTWFMKEDDNA